MRWVTVSFFLSNPAHHSILIIPFPHTQPDTEAYAAVPIEDFGAALLRGMGWNGEAIKSKYGGRSVPDPAVTPARPMFLGLGAKAKDPPPEKQTGNHHRRR
jgi:hypothetical protein